jgi:cell volume regulation protein A
VEDGRLILIVGGLLAASLVASMLAGRLRLPGLVLFLAVGMVVGSDGTGWIHFDDYEVARTVGIIALSLILFEGGLAAGYQEIRPVLVPAVSLAVVGTLITAVVSGLAAMWLFGFSPVEGLLVGAILSSTDGAAVFAILRGSTLERRLARTLEGEAGLNDPVAVLLVLSFIAWIEEPGFGVADMLQSFAFQMGVGLIVGVGVGWLASQALTHSRLPSAGLYPVASIATAAIAYGLADVLHGSGFLSVYLTGLALGSTQIPAKQIITTFHEGAAWLGQLAMFVTLGLLVFPSQLPEVVLQGSVMAIVVAFVARPLGVLAATPTWHYNWRERLVLGWAGLRGAVPVVLATFPVIAGVPHSLEFFNIAFFVVLLSTVIQGVSFEPVARLLGVTTAVAAIPRQLVDPGAIRRLGAEIVEYPVEPDDAIAGRRVRELGLSRDALLNLIVRGNQALPPRGSTRIEPGDRLHVLVRQEASMQMPALLERWKDGPIGTPRERPRIPEGRRIFSMRPWTPELDTGDLGRPAQVGRVDVIEQLRTRRDGVPGALVSLADGRYAFTGPVVALGSASLVQDAARRKLRQAGTDSDQAWWREVIGALAAPEEY